MSKVCIYTYTSRGYDAILPPPISFDDVDFILFSDDVLSCPGWTVRPLCHPINLSNPFLINRYYKLFPHLLLSEYQYSIYIDANIRLLSDLSYLVALPELSNNGILLLAHPYRSNVLEELEFCLQINKISPQIYQHCRSILESLIFDGFPFDFPLIQASLILRCHSNVSVRLSMDYWWDYISHYPSRDQFFLGPALFKAGVEPLLLDVNPYSAGGAVTCVPHLNHYHPFIVYFEVRRYHNFFAYLISELFRCFRFLLRFFARRI